MKRTLIMGCRGLSKKIYRKSFKVGSIKYHHLKRFLPSGMLEVNRKPLFTSIVLVLLIQKDVIM